jgi:hypothetical protein
MTSGGDSPRLAVIARGSTVIALGSTVIARGSTGRWMRQPSIAQLSIA